MLVRQPPLEQDDAAARPPVPATTTVPATVDAAGADSALFTAIVRQLRRIPTGPLTQLAVLGRVAIVVAVVAGPRWWSWLAPFVAVGAAGNWGLADRALTGLPAAPETRWRRRVLTVVRGSCAILGAAAALSLASMLLAGLFGRVIS